MKIINKGIFLLFLSIIPLTLIMNLGLIGPEYTNIILTQITNTVVVVFFVVTFSSILGFICAWLFSIYNFPLKKPIEIMLILSMVYPSYVFAFFYSEFFNVFGKPALIGTMVAMTLPYVFMIVSMSFRSQSQQLVDTALMFGKNNTWVHIKVLFPLVVHSVVISSLLVVGDTFSEFGATYFYGVDTVMTGIYEIWFGLGESEQGIRLAAWVFCMMFIIYYFVTIWKRTSLKAQRAFENNDLSETIKPRYPDNRTGWLMTFFTGSIVTLTFLIPNYVLFKWVINSYAQTNWVEVFLVSFNSVVLATGISMLVLLVTTIVFVLYSNKILMLSTLSNALYSTPGIVLAISSVFIIGLTSPILTPFLFIYILVMKFWAMGMNNIGVGIQKINQRFYYISKAFKKKQSWYIWNVQIPLSVKGYIMAAVMVWIDVIRELVISLTLRPQGLDLLSVEIFRFMDNEVLYMSGPWILMMVIITVIPITYLKLIVKGDN